MNSNPIEQFRIWFDEASSHKDIKEANALSLATATPGGVPSNRMVLLKEFDDSGFVFYTNLTGRKGRELDANPVAAMCFYWEPLGRQVRIEGEVEPVSNEEADAYFASRPLESRLGAWVSRQSEPLESMATLVKDVAKMGMKFATEDVPRPSHWSGFRLVPNAMEFWTRGEYRIHERRRFDREDERWRSALLYP